MLQSNQISRSHLSSAFLICLRIAFRRMAPKHRRVASGTTRSASPPSPAPKTVTIVPPTISAEAITSSKTPSYLKFPLVVIISFSLSAFAHNIFHAITGDRLNVVSPDGNPQWQLYATVAWRVTELAVGWFGGYDGMCLWHSLARTLQFGIKKLIQHTQPTTSSPSA